MADTGEGPLSSQAWNEVTFHHVHLAFLRAEWHKLPIKTGPADRRLVEYPNLTENAETSRRTQLVYSWRAPLMTQVPGDTRWYEVRYLEERHLNELLVIGRCGWDDPPDGNEITKVAARKQMRLMREPGQWSGPIMWGHSQAGPFTILEGNNRLVAYASSSPRPPLRLAVYIGLSAHPCIWHLPDPPSHAGA